MIDPHLTPHLWPPSSLLNVVAVVVPVPACPP
jgi:hypothetical protein